MKTLLTCDQLHAGVARMAGAITACYENRPLTVIGVLTGSVVIVADLIRLIDLPVRVGMIAASSYRGARTTPGELVIDDELTIDIAGRDVLLVEDIVDSGLTASYLLKTLTKRKPRSLRICTLLSKPERRQVHPPVDYVGFNIPNHYVVGYGLNYQQKYRNLPYLVALDQVAELDQEL